jgi:hypothetical protein
VQNGEAAALGERCGEAQGGCSPFIGAGVGRRGAEDTSDRWGPVYRETRERRPAREGVNRKGKRISREHATDARAGWAGRAILACGDGVAGGLAGPEAKRAAGSAGPKIRKKRNF